jgi:prepilin-type N-terminal cleavage/methylation domain-containing protein
MEMSSLHDSRFRVRAAAFTLIELLVVIAIIAVLIGLLFPTFQGIQNSAKKTQAKNDLTQIVTAVNAYYTEYGKYPATGAAATGDTTYGTTPTNENLFNTLRGLAAAAADNARGIVFLSPPDAKDVTNPRSGIASSSSSFAGQYFDPWGKPYQICIDTDYTSQIEINPYGANNGAGNNNIRQGVIAWSLGKDQLLGKKGNNIFTGSDDVISWQ